MKTVAFMFVMIGIVGCKIDTKPITLAIETPSNRKNPDEKKQEEEEGKKKKKKDKTPVEELKSTTFKLQKDHTYHVPLTPILNTERHVPYDFFEDKKQLGTLFGHVLTDRTDVDMKNMNVVLGSYLNIFSLYAQNQVELLYMFMLLLNSLTEMPVLERSFSEHYYYPNEYLKFGVRSDFENTSMLFYILSGLCLRPVILDTSSDPLDLKQAIHIFGEPFDENQFFSQQNERGQNFWKTHTYSARCDLNISSLIKKPNELKPVDGERRLDVVTSFSADRKSHIVTIEPTVSDHLDVYYAQPILLFQSKQLVWAVTPIADGSNKLLLLE